MHKIMVVEDFELDWCYEQYADVLCAERVSQMTKTYNDIDAVTRLLEEKERDLELAARIGQSLLKKNRVLSEQNEYLEEQVGTIREEVAQLHHELNLKDELLQFYTNAVEETEEGSGSPTPVEPGRAGVSACSGSSLDILQQKLRELEEENLSLRSEASHLKSETESYEEKEQQLVNDCVRELRQSSIQISSIAEELAKKTEDASRQQEEITHLLSQIVDLQKKAKTFAIENEELSQHLLAAKDAQRQLTTELQELEDKYSECIEMLHEAQEELKNLRNRSVSAGTPRRYHPLGLFPMDSLAAEIEGTMRKELSLENPDNEEQRVRHKRVFETVKNINQSVRQRSSANSATNIPGSNQTLSSLSSTLSDSNSNNAVPDNRTQSMLHETGSSDAAVDASEKRSGSEELKLALRRLSLRRQNCLSERLFFEGERERRNREPADSGDYSNRLVHSESIMSLGAWASRPYLPDKLQIVKPLEGSATLQHWQQLAQPNLGGILDARPGVVPKGYRPLELDLEEVYHYADYEEDDPGEHPGKCMAHTSSTYTFTTCKILHPSDELTRVTPSLNPVPTSSCVMSSSLRSTPAATPCTPRRMSLSQSQSFTNLRDSTKTFSTSLGLVRLLQERGISAAVYQPQSWDRGSGGVLFSTSVLPPPPPDPHHPTTPPNSPTRCTPSPGSVVSDSDTSMPFSFKSPSYENFLASKPARSILKEVAGVSGAQAKDCESQTDVSMYNLNLVDKLKRLGLASPGASGATGGGIPRPSPLIGPLGGLRRAGSPFSPLNEGMRRNRSYPAMVGASMAMKGPGPQGDEMLLAPKLPKQTSLK
ncbi:trafficking kinesin-binding protein 1 isoform X1 [Chanodichthys erythropterus]|uniref:trafficking kinesin-binding protein 1 isoform X1 n=2 Tax=Chanodichthys erythropterus TaxID=933992 RepID=UPI00351E5AFE